MQEIGGYIELEHFHGAMLHEGLIALNCGRACLRYLIRARKIRRIALPLFCCDSVREACQAEGTEVRLFRIGHDWMPQASFELRAGEWLYLVNAYGQLARDQIVQAKERYGHVILDEAQAYFEDPLPDIDTIYTCRKFYGVSDGAFLATDAPRIEGLPQDESYDRMRFLLGRFERPASEFYALHVANDASFTAEGIRRMSRLTENLLRGADDAAIQARRTENFQRLARALGDKNLLKLHVPTGPFAYPLLVPDGARLRKQLIAHHIYVPTLWPNVLEQAPEDSWEYTLASNVVPLPVDQRYGAEEMDVIVSAVMQHIA